MIQSGNVHNHDRWHGKRYICLARQSDDSTGTTSTQAQLDWLKRAGERLGMIHVDDVVLNGVTGSLPGKREDLQGLLDRKRHSNDYDVLLIQRLDRLTRGGTNHGLWFEYECEKLGVTVHYPGDDLPEDGRYSALIKAAKFDAAKEQARSIGQRSVQGWMHAIEQGRNAVVSRTPFGCDRLYLNSKDEPLFIIRSLGDGRQQKLDPDTHAVIDTYGRVGGGTKGHYRKQRDEKVLIVPGAPDRVKVVRDIFELHYRERWGGKRIADRLNRRGIHSPTGRGWSQRQVESIYENPIYCGLALGQRVSQGIYYSRDADQPRAIEHEPQVLATCRWAPRNWRPPEEWQWQEQPLMDDFLPPDLREQALTRIRKLWSDRWLRSQDPTRPKRSASRHKASEYVLTGVLVARQDGEPLTGVLCGRVGQKKRYYRHRRGKIGYRKGSTYNKMIAAGALEDAVWALIGEIVADMPTIRRRVLETIKTRASSCDPAQELTELRRQREQVTKQVQRVVRLLTEADYADAEPELARLRTRREDLERQIAVQEAAQRHAAEDPEVLADRVIERLKAMTKAIDTMSPAMRRELIEAFVERVEVDLESKDATVALRLPPWALVDGHEPMRPAHSSPSSTSRQTHPLPSIHLACAHCRYHHDRSAHAICYECRRSAA